MQFWDIPSKKLKAPDVVMKDFETVLRHSSVSSVSKEELKKYTEWTKQFGQEGGGSLSRESCHIGACKRNVTPRHMAASNPSFTTKIRAVLSIVVRVVLVCFVFFFFLCLRFSEG
jgi:hypothetical protein